MGPHVDCRASGDSLLNLHIHVQKPTNVHCMALVQFQHIIIIIMANFEGK